MKTKTSLLFLISILLIACEKQPMEHRTVLCIPVYGQSLALGEEAERITDFDSLANYADGRIVTENLDHDYGYFENNDLKRFAKKLVGYRKRSFELSVYTMAQRLADHIGKDTLICIFPGGQGATLLSNLSKGTQPYQDFMESIETAYQQTIEKGWDFFIPAICWMQGESDIEDYPGTNYQQELKQIWEDMNSDIRKITQQKDTICFICYQTNSLARGRKYNANHYDCIETAVPQTFVNLLRDDKWFWASGPTYPYPCVGEKIHIDATGQQHIGELAARSVLGILRTEPRNCGLIPIGTSVNGREVIVRFNVPCPPLAFDTLQVQKARNYGFSVISKENHNIAQFVSIEGNSIKITCAESPHGCKVRYAVNGDSLKSGNLHGPRGNLRDSSGNWSYLFDQPL
jgi:hypothetical protein